MAIALVAAFAGATPASADGTIGSGIVDPTGIALDAAGDVFISDDGNNDVVEESPDGHGGYTQSTVDSTANSYPQSVAVNSSGDVFIVSDIADGELLEDTPNGDGTYSPSAENPIDTSLYGPQGMVVDAAGDLFIADRGYGRVVEDTPNGDGTYTRNPTPVDSPLNGDLPWGIAIDASGDLFITDWNANRVVELSPDGGGGYTRRVIVTGLDQPTGVAVDAAGDLFIADRGSGRLLEETPYGNGNYAQHVLASGGAPQSVAVDGSGDLFYGGFYGRAVNELQVPIATAQPLITGTAQDGQTLNVTPGSWTGSSDSISYQWQRCDGSGNNCQNVAGATGTTYSLTRADVGDQIAVVVTATNQSSQAGYAATVTGPVTDPPAPYASSAVRIAGLPEVGDILRVYSAGNWKSPDPLTYSYQWEDCSPYPSTCQNISGATSNYYELTSADAGQQVTVTVTATDAEGQSGSASAAPLDTVTSDLADVSSPYGVAVDSSGDVFVTSGYPAELIEEKPDGNGGYTSTVVDTNLSYPNGIAIDAAGDVFVADSGNQRIIEATPNGDGTYTPHEVVTGLNFPNGVAVDSSGDLFIANTENSQDYLLEETPNGSGGYTQQVLGRYPALEEPFGLTVDSSGDLFVADSYHSRVVEYKPAQGGGYTSTVVDADLGTPYSVAVDAYGDLFIADPGLNKVFEDRPVAGAGYYVQSVVDSNVSSPFGVAVGGGTLYVADTVNSRVVALQEPVDTTLPTITGTLRDGQTLGRTVGSWVGPGALTYAYQWQRCDASGANCQNVAGATGSGYKLTRSDVGHELVLLLTATNAEGISRTVSSAAVGPVGNPTPPASTSPPTITGSATVGQTLSLASRGTWTSPDSLTYSYHWQRCDGSGDNCQNIIGATGTSYTPTSADLGDEITLQVTATDAEGQGTGATATPVGPVVSPTVGSVYYPFGVALDSSGDVFIANTFAGNVLEEKPDGSGGYTESVVDSNVGEPFGVAVDSSGDVFIADTYADSVLEDKPNGDGTYTQSTVDSSLNDPEGVAVDSAGDVFVADTNDDRVVEDKPNGDGTYTQTTVDSSLYDPEGVAVDSAGDVFVADSYDDRVVEDKPNGDGTYTSTVVDSNLFYPGGVAVDSAGDVFVADTDNGRLVEDKPNGSGGWTQSVVYSNLSYPQAVAVGPADVFVADTDNSRIIDLKVPVATAPFSISGAPQDGQTLHASGQWSGGAGLTFAYQWLRCDGSGAGCQAIARATGSAYKLSRLDIGHQIALSVTVTAADGLTTTAAASAVGPVTNPAAPSNSVLPKVSGIAEPGDFLTVGSNGTWASPDPLAYSYQWQSCTSSDPGTCQNIDGATGSSYQLTNAYTGDWLTVVVTATDSEGQVGAAATAAPFGPVTAAIDASFATPWGVATDGAGDVFVADAGASQVVRESPNGSGGYSRTSITGQSLSGTYGVAVDSSGDVFIAAAYNDEVAEETPNGSGGYVQSIVASDPNVASPVGLAVDRSGDVFVADNSLNRVVEEKPNGSGGWTQSVVDSNLLYPSGVAVDSSGNVFVADAGNGRVVEDKPNGSGGWTQSVVDPNAGYPYGVAVDSSDDVFVADTYDGRVVEDVPDGSGGYGRTFIGGYGEPVGLAVDPAGELFVADAEDNDVTARQEPVDTTPPSIAGTLQDGQTLRATGVWNGPGPLSYSYRWQRCSGGTCQNISGATGASYRLTPADIGSTIDVVVTAVNAEGISRAVKASAVGPVTNPSPPSAVSPPKISGIRGVGETLKLASRGLWSSPDALTYAYQWQRCDQYGNNCQDVVGATGTTYVLTSADVGYQIALQVTATDAEAQVGTATSTPVGPVGQYPLIGSGWQYPVGVAVDGAGDVFVTDMSTNELVEETPDGYGGYTQTTIASTNLSGPQDVAVDSAGDLFVADTNNNRVVEYAPNGSGGYQSPTTVDSALNYPVALNFDSSGDLWIADSGDNSVVEDVPNGSGGYARNSAVELDASTHGLNSPYGVAVDSSGDVFISDLGNQQVVEETPNGDGTYTQSTVDTGILYPIGLGLNAAGDLFVGDNSDGSVLKETPNGSGGWTRSTVDGSVPYAWGLTVDSAGDVIAGSADYAPPVEIPAPVNVRAPWISGTPTTGQTLRAYVGSWTSIDSIAYSYQWQRCSGSGGSCAPIAGATSSYYKLTKTDAGHEIGLVVTAANEEGVSAQATATPFGPDQNPAPVNTVLPSIGGVAEETKTLTGTTGSWKGLDSLTYTYQWQYCDGSGCHDIPGATGRSYRLIHSDVGDRMAFVVTATDQEGDSASETTTAGPVLAASIVDGGLYGPESVAVDSSGDVFVADTYDNRVVEDTPNGSGGWTQTVVDANLSDPYGVAVDSHGDVFVADTYNQRVVEDTPNGDGTWTQTVVDANLNYPCGVAVDSQGDLFVADTYDNQVVEETPNGDGTWTKTPVDSDLNIPYDVAVDSSGDVFVADTDNSRVVEDKPGGPSGWTQSVVDSNLYYPGGVAVDSSGDVFVADSYDDRVLEDEPNGSGGYTQNVLAGSSELDTPFGVAVDSSGDVFIADTYDDRVLELPAPANTSAPIISGIPQDGQTLRVGSVGRWTALDSLAYSYHWQRCGPSGNGCQNIAGATGSAYKLTSADATHEIRLLVTATDQEGVAGSATATAVGPVADPAPPSNTVLPTISGTPQVGKVLARVSVGSWTSPDPLHYTYQWQRCADSNGDDCSTIQGATGSTYKLASADAGDYVTLQVTATDAEGQATGVAATPTGPVTAYSVVDSGLGLATGVAVDSSGDVFIADGSNDKVVEDTPNGSGGYTRSLVASGDLVSPEGIAVDSQGDVFVADTGNDRVVEETPDGSGGYTQSLVAGGFNYPQSVAVDASGDVFVADTNDGKVVEATPDGSGGYTTSTLSTTVSGPTGVAVDSSGDVFIAGSGVIVEETPNGGGYTETTLSTGVSDPYGLAIDGYGDLFIQQAVMISNNLVRRVVEARPDGAGGYSQQPLTNGDDVGWPTEVALDSAGDVFVADLSGRVIELAAPANISQPSVSGTAEVGQVLTRSVGTWHGIDSLTYATQWQRCNSAGHNCVNIAGATSGSYRVTDADVGYEIGLVVTATDQEGVSGRAAATPVGPVIGVTEISAGAQHTCALLSIGSIECWGRNDNGQLGDGTTNDSSTPVAVTGITTATSVSAGGTDTCAVLAGGTVDCWGDNYYGQLGDGTRNESHTPVAVTGITNATAVSVGNYHACALLADGTVECWGFNYSGQLGDGQIDGGSPQEPEYVLTPVAVVGIDTATSVSIGYFDTCASLANGMVDCWGDDGDGVLGDGGALGNSASPVAVTGITTATSVDAGTYHNCADLGDGTVECWGADDLASSAPTPVSGITNATAVSAGDDHTCLRLADGTVECWGNGWSAGDLGNGSTGDSATPVVATGISTATSVSAGGYHSCALLAGGTVECWGLNTYGELGNGTTTDSSIPVAVVGLP